MARHGLLGPALGGLAEVAGAVCGIHAQMLTAAEVSLAMRVEGATRDDVRSALWKERSLVKTYGLRGTLHLYPAPELALWLAAFRARDANPDPRRMAGVGLNPARLEGLVGAIRDALDHRSLTGRALGEEIVLRLGAWSAEPVGDAFGSGWPRWRYALGEAANQGALCFAPDQGREVAYARTDQWVPGWHRPDPVAALAEAFRRYLRAYGPATARDFGQWFGISPVRARGVAESIRAELAEVEVDGNRSWLLADDVELAPARAEGSVRLLPHFDCYLIGCHPRSALVPVQADRVLARGQAGPVPALLVDGIVAGVWQRKPKGRAVQLEVEPFHTLDPARLRALEAEAARLARILGAETTLVVGPTRVRRHL